MKHLKENKRIVASLVIVTILAIASICVVLADNSEIMANAEQMFLDMGITDAAFQGYDPYLEELSDTFLHYYSNETEMDYYFDADTGLLRFARARNVDEILDNTGTGEQTVYSVESVSGDSKQIALDYASVAIAPYLIGELRVVSENFNNYYHICEIREYFQGQETGTKSSLFYTPDGTVFNCINVIGSVFQKNADGVITPVNGDILIEETTAVSVAKEAVCAKMQERGWGNNILEDTVTCNLEASGDKRFFMVEMTTDTQWGTIFWVEVDAYSGEILDLYFTQ